MKVSKEILAFHPVTIILETKKENEYMVEALNLLIQKYKNKDGYITICKMFETLILNN